MPELQLTDDGSHTVFSEEFGEKYHSRFGAITESLQVFINAGLKSRILSQSKIDVLEVGLGTGLNALLTWVESEKAKTNIFYTAVEAFPLPETNWRALNFGEILGGESHTIFEKIHRAEWGQWAPVSDSFSILKLQEKVENTSFQENFDLIYYDAFAPDSQPELWTLAIFRKMFNALRPDGILTTYCAKGEVKRNLKATGFLIESLPGPPGKREMTRATKPAPIV